MLAKQNWKCRVHEKLHATEGDVPSMVDYKVGEFKHWWIRPLKTGLVDIISCACNSAQQASAAPPFGGFYNGLLHGTEQPNRKRQEFAFGAKSHPDQVRRKGTKMAAWARKRLKAKRATGCHEFTAP